jgi:DNA-directed RNA polymerase subunit RPC12/RpoP
LFLTQRRKEAKAFLFVENRRCRWVLNVKCFYKAMSEFKYACPVCGQHMMCDSSQSGTVMECPTCFQKITAPQAPATDDTKFIITGTKVGERPVPKFPEASQSFVPAAKGFPGALVVVVIFIFIGVAVAFVYRGTIFKSKDNSTTATNGGSAETNQVTVKTPKPPKPAPVAPPASDTNWMLNLDAVAIPDSPAAGRIHGQDFIAERASYSTNGVLTIRAGTRGTVDFGLNISLNGAAVETLAGRNINVTTNADKSARLTLRWKEGDEAKRENYNDGYAMRLEFGALANNRLPGKIYLCTPDETKSYVAGTFNVEIRKPRPPKQN